MDKIFLMNAFEAFHDFYNNFDCVFKRKNFSW
jgi:hypothetical protein